MGYDGTRPIGKSCLKQGSLKGQTGLTKAVACERAVIVRVLIVVWTPGTKIQALDLQEVRNR